MRTSFFIARRIIASGRRSGSQASPVLRIAIAGVALSVAVMLVSVAVVTGFKKQIREKVIGFGSHIQIVNYDNNFTFETKPINGQQPFLPDLMKNKLVRHVQRFSLKGGVIKTHDQIQAIAIKGIDQGFDWSFFEQNMVEGSRFECPDSVPSNKAVISKYLAGLLNIKTGDAFQVYFIQQPVRVRKFVVSGIYRTSIEDFDKLFILADMRHIQKVNGWDADQITGFEILVNDFDQLDAASDDVFHLAGYTYTPDGMTLSITTIKDRYPQIFNWLDLLDMNVWIILGLMLIVAGFNMISGILILILERTFMIGILKSVGMNNWNIRQIFITQALYLTMWGLLIGNLAGMGICFIQKYTGMLRLDESAYYLSAVPVNISTNIWLAVNFFAMLGIFIMLLLPSWIVTRIMPARTLRFE